MVHATQDQLQWAPFGTDDQINAGQVFFKFLFQLILQQEQKGNEAHPQGKEHDAQEHGERFESKVLPA